MCADIRLPLHISSQQKQKPKTPHSHHLPPLPYLDVHLRWDRSPYALNAACLAFSVAETCHAENCRPRQDTPPASLSEVVLKHTFEGIIHVFTVLGQKAFFVTSLQIGKLQFSVPTSFFRKKMAREKYHQGLRKSCFFNFVASFTTRLCLYKYINVCVCGVYKRTHLCAKELTTSPPSRPLGGLASLLPPSSSSSSSSRACKCRCSISLHHFHSKTSNSHKNATPKLYKINLHFQQMSVPAPNPLVYLQPRMALQVGAYLDGPFWGVRNPGFDNYI